MIRRSRDGKHNTGWLALQILRLWLRGWKQVPGYTVVERQSEGGVYFSVWLDREGE